MGVVGATDRVELASILLRHLSESVRLPNTRGHQGLNPVVHLLSLGHGSSLIGVDGYAAGRTAKRLVPPAVRPSTSLLKAHAARRLRCSLLSASVARAVA